MAEKTILELNDGDFAKQRVLQLACRHFGSEPETFRHLKGDGSDRQIFHLSYPDITPSEVVGVFYANVKENRDFISITGKMQAASLPVPEIYRVDDGDTAYLIQYLGKQNLGERIDDWIAGDGQDSIEHAYRRVIPYLIQMQTALTPLVSELLKGRVMGADTFVADLDYFRRDFLKRFGYERLIHSGVQSELYDSLLSDLGDTGVPVFVYRDFQSRNIMWWRGNPWFIDYQSAFLGPRYYDLASLLYSSKSGLDEQARERLLTLYYEEAHPEESLERFWFVYHRFVLLRRLRSLGSYGYLGMEKRKEGFLGAIEPSLQQLIALLLEKEVLKGFVQTLEMLTEILEDWQRRGRG